MDFLLLLLKMMSNSSHEWEFRVSLKSSKDEHWVLMVSVLSLPKENGRRYRNPKPT
jgi:hypothetical protein